MVDKSTQLILDALSRAVADPAGLPLHGGKAASGLFPTTPAARQVAQRCKDDGFLRVVHTETKGKTTVEVCTITEKGLAHLLSEVSPKQVLQDLVRALEARQAQAGELLSATRQMQTSLDALKATAEKVLQQVVRQPALPVSTNGDGSEACVSALLAYLGHWQASGASEDCPLPELYRQTQQTAPHLTIGRFHDALRRLHEQQQVYLHPWTGPMYDIPEPPYALLIGHEIAYYVSLRQKAA
jgi:hypothetical protein